MPKKEKIKFTTRLQESTVEKLREMSESQDLTHDYILTPLVDASYAAWKKSQKKK